jgi:anti-sigma regulatory factor (Ser/Thr protein kinase)
MAQTNDLNILLEMLPEPAFTVSEGRITLCNTKAQNLFLTPGQELSSLLSTDSDHSTSPTAEATEVNLVLGDLPCSAIATPMGTCTVCRLDPYHTTPELKGMNLLANLVRLPICDALYAAQQLEAKGNTEEDISSLQHALYRVLRILSNTSNAERFATEGASNHQMMDVTAVCAEILEEAAKLLEGAGLTLKWSVPDRPILSFMNHASLLHALYNLINNAAKASTSGGAIEAEVTCTGKQIRISVCDHGAGIPDEILTNLFTQHSRHSEVYSNVWGMGLGMHIVRTFAKTHNGSIFVDRVKEGGTRITVTAAIDDRSSKVKNSIVTIAPPAHESMTLLSDVLPSEMFPPKD